MFRCGLCKNHYLKSYFSGNLCHFINTYFPLFRPTLPELIAVVTTIRPTDKDQEIPTGTMVTTVVDHLMTDDAAHIQMNAAGVLLQVEGKF